jgi:raffinose/stachyose/melibiose transport system substrate-binding protein
MGSRIKGGMRMKRRNFTIVLLGVCLVLCGSGLFGQSAKSHSGTVNVNMVAGPGASEAWNAVAKAYMAKNPGAKIVVDLKPQDGYDQWLKSQFGSDNPSADLVAINYAHAASIGKRINWLEYMDLKSPYSGKSWKDQYNFQMQTIDPATNEMYLLSLESVQVLWVYNRALFSKVGVQPPKTWKEFVAVCDKLQKAGIQPLAVPGDFNSFWAVQMGWLAQIYADQTTRSLIKVYGAKEGDFDYDPDMDGKFKYDPTDPFNDDTWKVNSNPIRFLNAVKDGSYKPDSVGMKTVWNHFKEVFPKYSGGNAFFGTKDALPLFYQGKAAILLDGAWRLPLFKNDMDKLTKGEAITSGDTKIDGVQRFDIGTFNMPSMDGPGIEAPARTIEVPIGFLGAIKKDKTHDDLVADFLMFYSSKEGMSTYISAGLKAGWTPAGPSLVKDVSLPAEYAAMFKDLKFIGNVQKGYGSSLSRGAPPDIQESLRDWYGYSQDFLTGKIGIDAWAAKHKANILKYLPDSMKALKITEDDLKNPQNAPSGNN